MRQRDRNMRPPNVKVGQVVRLRYQPHLSLERRVTYGLVRRVRSKTVHIHLARRSPLAPAGEFFLVEGQCLTVSKRDIVARLPGVIARTVEGPGAWRDASGNCDACTANEVNRALMTPTRVDHGFRYDGEIYHPGDVAYFVSDSALTADTTWDIGVIVAVNLPTVQVRRCGRISDLGLRDRFVSEKEAFLTDLYETRQISTIAAKATGKLSLKLSKHLHDFAPATRRPQIELHPLAEEDIPKCAICVPGNGRNKEGRRNANRLRLPSLDLYAGGGGSALGASRHFEIRHAVDMDPTCCATLEQNRRSFFPKLNVHHCAVSDLREKQSPRPGGVALMFAGPPCQGHSKANHHRNPSDDRNDEIATTLDEVDRLRPAVFVLENVPGLKDDNGGKNYMTEVLQRLLAMRYQVRVAILNAQDYGSPQRRKRLIFLATRSGIPLPVFPRPTHSAPPTLSLLPINGKMVDIVPFPRYGTAPFPAITAKAALHDLPLWDIEQYRPVGGVVGPSPCGYARSPRTDYQKNARRGGTVLLDHVTKSPSIRELELIYTAPRARKANEATRGSQGEDAASEGSVRRLDPHGPVCTLLTSSRPGGKGTGVIHYGCMRTLTVAERKRVQGFPDTYRLCGNVLEMDKMIGNAVNVHLADALCRQIKEDVFLSFWRDLGEPDSATFWDEWRYRHPL